MRKRVSIKTINKNKTSKTLLNVFMLTSIMFIIGISTVYALSYTVSYNNNGGSGTMSDSTFTSNPGTLSTNTFTKSGYKFMGWNKNSGGTSDWYRETNSITGTDGSSTTLYAQWCPNSEGTLKISNTEVKDSYGNYVFGNNKYITVTADNKTITYGGTPSYSYTVSGTLNGEVGVTGTASYTVKDSSNTTINPSNAAVGSYTISVSGLSAASGYEIQSTNTGTLTINAQACNAPTSVAISTAGRVTWTTSSNCASAQHQVSIDGTNWTNASSGYDYLSTIIAGTGTRTVRVRAVAPNSNYTTSSAGTASATVYAISFATNDANKGTVSPTAYNVISGATVTTSGNNLVIKGITSGSTTTNLTTIVPTPKTGYILSNWNKTSGSLTETQTITATFVENTYTVTADANGGTIPTTTGWTDGIVTTNSLPSTYRELEYIQSTGTQYIDTGYKTKPNTGIEVTYQFNETYTVQQRVYSTRTTTSTGMTDELYINGTRQFGYGYQNGDGNWISTGVQADTLVHTFKHNVTTGYWSIDNGPNTAISGTVTNNSANNLFIMTRNDDGTAITDYNGKLKIYSFKIYEDGSLVKNYVPAYRVSDGVIGLYDKINGDFKINAGSGAFEKGLPIATKSVTYNSAYGTLPIPTRDGYTFTGWYTDETDGTQITDESTASTAADHTIYAHWTCIGMVNQTYTAGNTVTYGGESYTVKADNGTSVSLVYNGTREKGTYNNANTYLDNNFIKANATLSIAKDNGCLVDQGSNVYVSSNSNNKTNAPSVEYWLGSEAVYVPSQVNTYTITSSNYASGYKHLQTAYSVPGSQSLATGKSQSVKYSAGGVARLDNNQSSIVYTDAKLNTTNSGTKYTDRFNSYKPSKSSSHESCDDNSSATRIVLPSTARYSQGGATIGSGCSDTSQKTCWKLCGGSDNNKTYCLIAVSATQYKNQIPAGTQATRSYSSNYYYMFAGNTSEHTTTGTAGTNLVRTWDETADPTCKVWTTYTTSDVTKDVYYRPYVIVKKTGS